jgi:hypothetical protein
LPLTLTASTIAGLPPNTLKAAAQTVLTPAYANLGFLGFFKYYKFSDGESGARGKDPHRSS